MFCVYTVFMFMCTRRLGMGLLSMRVGVFDFGARFEVRHFCFVWRWPVFLAVGVLYIHVYIYIYICVCIFVIYNTIYIIVLVVFMF